MDISALITRLFVIASFLLVSAVASGQKSDSLFVFIGEVISVVPFTQEEVQFDATFKAKCRVIEIVFGHYEGDTIEFEVRDHFGRPKFENYQYVLMYTGISRFGNRFHLKYTYQDVYQAEDGRWASPYKRDIYYNYSKYYPEIQNIEPEKINFGRDVWYTFGDRSKKSIRGWYRKPYYRIKDNKVYPLMGHSVQQLFELMKMTTLKAHGYFE